MNGPWKIPDSWTWHKIGDVAKVVGGGTPITSNPDFFGGEIPWVTPADLSGYREKYISKGSRNLSQAGYQSSGAKLMPVGTVLFSSRAPIGYVAIASQPVCTNQGFKSFIFSDVVIPEFGYYYLQHAKPIAERLAGGTTFKEISGQSAKLIPIPIPPIDLQRRLVEHMEVQFSRLTVAIDTLLSAQVKLKTYRASVLKAACEGRLVPTEAELARREGRDYETGAQLLTRIQETRRQSWTGKGKYQEPVPPASPKTGLLPEGWVNVNFGQVTEIALGKMLDKAKHREGRSMPYLRNINVRWGRIDADDLSQMFFRASELERFSVKQGDLLVCEGGEPGRAAIWKRADSIMYQKALHRVRPKEGVLAEFLLISLEHIAKHGSLAKMFTGSTIKHFPKEIFVQLETPLPPLAEQIRIVAEVERRLSVIDQLEATVSANLKRATRLRQSILQKAFNPSPPKEVQP